MAGQVAAGRILNVLNADAKVTVVCPRSGLNDEVAYRVEQGQVAHVDRVFEASDLDGADMVLAAIDDPAASSEIWQACRARRIPANIADVPPECAFDFGRVDRDGPLQVMVSTNGNGPRLASLVRRQIAGALPPNAGAAIARVGMLRRKLRRVAPDQDQGSKRMRWMSRVCDQWNLEDLAGMTDDDMDSLLAYYAPNDVPSLQQVRGQPDFERFEFDGSFGWF